MSTTENGAALPPGAPAAGTRPVRSSSWAPALVVLGAGLALLGGMFSEEVAAAVRTWDGSTAYNHCWLVLPIAAWLGWTRRRRLTGLVPAPAPLLAFLALPAGLAWLLAERLGIMEGRQFAALALAEILVLAVLGRRVCRAMAAPLAYLVFLVPFGAFAVPALQQMTARMVEAGLNAFGIPNFVDQLIIEIPAGTFLVAEACAGLRFVIAALAFGALYALVMFRDVWRRLVVMALALTVPIAANGLRALGLVLLGHHQGSAAAVEADHVLYGWAFFSIVILLLVAAGLPFRQDGGEDPAAPPGPGAAPRRPDAERPPPRPRALAVAAGLALAPASLGVALTRELDRHDGQPPEVVVPRLAAPGGCESAAGGTEVRCAGAVASARLLAFPPRVNWSAVAHERRRLSGGGDEDITFGVSVPGGSAAWRARQPRTAPSDLVAVAAWLGGKPAGDGVRSRAKQAWNGLSGGGGTPVVAAVSLRLDGAAGGAWDQARARAVLTAVLEEQERGLAEQAAKLSGRR